MALPNNTIVDFLDNKQPEIQHFNLSPPSASSINIRRHSSHHCQIIDNVSEEQKCLKTQPVLPIAPTSVPPPVPKRTFQKIAEQTLLESPTGLRNNDNSSTTTPTKVKRRNSKRSSSRRQQQNRIQSSGTTYNSVEQSSDDDLLSLESVFEDSSNDLPVFETPQPFINSNRSSSDSNKSQTTIDTGYMTSASNDNDRIFFGGSDNYRSRFSSVDTQSSVDSISDTQKCINSPLSSGGQIAKTYHRNNSNLPNFQNPKMIRNEDGTNRRPPVVPVRKQTSVPKIPPPISSTNRSTRGAPPAPPIRSQNSLDSARILQNGHILGVFQTNSKHPGSAQEMYSKPMIGTISKNTPSSSGPKTPSLTQMHHSKLTQRQDSNISSDSYSMTSSPGYNTKSMEAPLLQHASKINKSGIRHQDSNDSFGMTSRYIREGASIRQDSNVSSDSFSQTSSPGYNTKLIEAPLIAHAVKLHASE